MKTCGQIDPLPSRCVRRPRHKGKHATAAELEAASLRFVIRIVAAQLKAMPDQLRTQANLAGWAKYMESRLELEAKKRRRAIR